MATLKIIPEIENTLKKLGYKIKEKRVYTDGFLIDTERRADNASYVITVSSKDTIIDFMQAVYVDAFEKIHIIFTRYRFTIIFKRVEPIKIDLSMAGEFRETLSEAISLKTLINFIHVFTEPPAGPKGAAERSSFVKDIIKQVLDKT